MKRVYLGGPINKCTDAEARDWREAAKGALQDNFILVDPMVRDYRGMENNPGVDKLIMAGDEEDFGSCDIGLFYCPKPSDGTSMEIRDMYKWLKRTTVIVCPQDRPSPWITGNSTHFCRTFDEAFEVIRSL